MGEASGCRDQLMVDGKTWEIHLDTANNAGVWQRNVSFQHVGDMGVYQKSIESA